MVLLESIPDDHPNIPLTHGTVQPHPLLLRKCKISFHPPTDTAMKAKMKM
jgi:hypothetical protein